MLIWSVPWAALGLIAGLAFSAGAFAGLSVETNFPGGIVPAMATAGAITGAINGLVFGVLLMLGERNRRISEMRASRVGLWSALASTATMYLGLGELVPVAAAGVLGFVGGVLALRIAARGERPDPTAG
jgi:hypothetical protein